MPPPLLVIGPSAIIEYLNRLQVNAVNKPHASTEFGNLNLSSIIRCVAISFAEFNHIHNPCRRWLLNQHNNNSSFFSVTSVKVNHCYEAYGIVCMIIFRYIIYIHVLYTSDYLSYFYRNHIIIHTK